MWADFPKFKHRKQAIYRGPGGAGDATVDATNATAYVAIKTQEAIDAATAAAASAAEAAASAVIASDGLDGIAAYADAAFGSAADALASETNAADSEANAAISEANAATSAAAAALSEDNAAISEANANEDAGTATTKAAEAADSADEAAASAAAALLSQNSAASSALDAANSAAAAEGYLPSFTGNNGKYLKTNGTSALWATVDALPSQTGNSGKYLTTNGTAASWVPLSVDAASPTVTGTVFGRTDSGIYSPPAVVDVRPIADSDYPGGFSDSAHTIHINSTSLYQSRPGSQLFSAIAAGTIQVGMTLSIICVVSATGLKTTVNLGTITNISYYYDGYTYATITFSGTLDTTGLSRADLWGNYLFHIWDFVLGGTIAENVTLGQNAGVSLTTGGENVIIGANAGNSINAGRNNVVIGNAADSSATSVSNEITLGNSSHTKTRLFGALAVGGSSTGTSGQVLTSGGSGSAPSWTTITSSGTVTSVALTAPTGLTVTGSPITASGTLAVTYSSGYSIPLDSSQTNWDTAYGWGNHASAGYLASATAATTYQPLDGDLTAIAALSGTNGFLTKTGTNTWSIDTTSYVSSVAATSPVASSGGATPTISLSSGYGDTQNPFASKTANYVLAAPNGTAGAPTFRAIVAADIPTLNQNTTGTAANITATSNSTLTTLSSLSLPGSQVSGNISGNAANVTGTVAIANGGSGQTTAQAAMNAFAGAVTSGSYLRGNGTNVVMSTIQAADVPTLNQNTTGTAANVTGTVAVANGGTGSATLTANNVLLGNGTSALQVVAPGTSGNVLTSNGTTWVSSAPSGGGGSSITAGDSSVAVTDTGTNGTIKFTTDNVERARIDSSGWLGVGATAPLNSNYKFSVVGTRTNLAANSSALNLYLQYSSATNGFFIGSPSADALSFSDSNGTERARIDASGNYTQAGGTWNIQNAGTTVGTISAASGDMNIYSQNGGYLKLSAAGSTMFFSTSGSERARIDGSGNLLVGTTSSSAKLTVVASGTAGSFQCGNGQTNLLTTNTSGTASYYAWIFYNNGTSYSKCGDITVSGTTTAFTTSSDYRLKENVKPMTGALEKVSRLRPVSYNWKFDGSESNGFIAHELQEVEPLCVTGQKDDVNEDGSIKPQGIDTSFLVATLTAAIQEQQGIIETLTARITALEGQ